MFDSIDKVEMYTMDYCSPIDMHLPLWRVMLPHDCTLPLGCETSNTHMKFSINCTACTPCFSLVPRPRGLGPRLAMFTHPAMHLQCAVLTMAFSLHSTTQASWRLSAAFWLGLTSALSLPDWSLMSLVNIQGSLHCKLATFYNFLWYTILQLPLLL